MSEEGAVGVDIGPFQNITGVGWGGDILWMIYASDGIGAFGPSDNELPDWAFRLTSPAGHESDVFIGRLFGAGDGEQTYPSGSPVGERTTLVQAVAGVNRIKDDQYPDGEGFRVLGSSGIAWAIEISQFKKLFTQEMLDGGPPGAPDAMTWALIYGSTSSFVPGLADAKVRWVIYPGTARKLFANVLQTADEYLAANGVMDSDGMPSTVTADYILDALMIRNEDLTIFPFKEMHTEGAPTPAASYGPHKHMFWDVLNRGNKIGYPPDGAKPEWRSA